MTCEARRRGEHAEPGMQEGWTKKIARLCTIGHDLGERGAPSPVARGERVKGRVLAIFCRCLPFRLKKYFFLPLLTFIHLYPPLLGWSGAEGDAGRRTAGRKRVRATLAQDPPRGGGRNAVPADADDCRPILMLLTGVSHSEGIVKAHLEENAEGRMKEVRAPMFTGVLPG